MAFKFRLILLVKSSQDAEHPIFTPGVILLTGLSQIGLWHLMCVYFGAIVIEETSPSEDFLLVVHATSFRVVFFNRLFDWQITWSTLKQGHDLSGHVDVITQDDFLRQKGHRLVLETQSQTDNTLENQPIEPSGADKLPYSPADFFPEIISNAMASKAKFVQARE